jgi:hypothetical protein
MDERSPKEKHGASVQSVEREDKMPDVVATNSYGAKSG